MTLREELEGIATELEEARNALPSQTYCTVYKRGPGLGLTFRDGLAALVSRLADLALRLPEAEKPAEPAPAPSAEGEEQVPIRLSLFRRLADTSTAAIALDDARARHGRGGTGAVGAEVSEPILVIYESAEKWRIGCDLSLGRPQIGLVPVPWAPGYYGGDDGRVYSTRCPSGGVRRWPRPLKTTERRTSSAPRGYHNCALRVGGGRLDTYIHTVVCSAFRGERPDGHETSHLDGDASNNRPENVAWETHGENQRRRILHGTDLCGERHPGAKLSAVAVAELRRLWAAGGVTQRALAARFGVGQVTVSRIVRRVRWSRA